MDSNQLAPLNLPVWQMNNTTRAEVTILLSGPFLEENIDYPSVTPQGLNRHLLEIEDVVLPYSQPITPLIIRTAFNLVGEALASNTHLLE